MIALEIIRDRVADCWAVVDPDGFEVASFDTLHDAEQYVIERGDDG